MWKPEHRVAADRSGLRYPSDLTDTEWVLVEALIPLARHGGRRRSVNVREVLNGIFYILWTGCQWKALPKDLPPKSTVHDYLELWNWDGTLERIHHATYPVARAKILAWPNGSTVPGSVRTTGPSCPIASETRTSGTKSAVDCCAPIAAARCCCQRP